MPLGSAIHCHGDGDAAAPRERMLSVARATTTDPESTPSHADMPNATVPLAPWLAEWHYGQCHSACQPEWQCCSDL